MNLINPQDFAGDISFPFQLPVGVNAHAERSSNQAVDPTAIRLQNLRLAVYSRIPAVPVAHRPRQDVTDRQVNVLPIRPLPRPRMVPHNRDLVKLAFLGRHLQDFRGVIPAAALTRLDDADPHPAVSQPLDQALAMAGLDQAIRLSRGPQERH